MLRWRKWDNSRYYPLVDVTYGYRIRNEKEVAMKPSDMPTKGYTQEDWDKMGFKN